MFSAAISDLQSSSLRAYPSIDFSFYSRSRGQAIILPRGSPAFIVARRGGGAGSRHILFVVYQTAIIFLINKTSCFSPFAGSPKSNDNRKKEEKMSTQTA
jgi:hypothetical protein